VGKMLQLPHFVHVVQPGETLWTISDRYGVSMEQIVQSNQLEDSSLISVSQSLIIPNPDRPLTEVNAYTTRVGEAGSGEVYALGITLRIFHRSVITSEKTVA